ARRSDDGRRPGPGRRSWRSAAELADPGDPPPRRPEDAAQEKAGPGSRRQPHRVGADGSTVAGRRQEQDNNAPAYRDASHGQGPRSLGLSAGQAAWLAADQESGLGKQPDRRLRARPARGQGYEAELAGLEARLIRRLYYDVTGLPPTAQEVEAF